MKFFKDPPTVLLSWTHGNTEEGLDTCPEAGEVASCIGTNGSWLQEKVNYLKQAKVNHVMYVGCMHTITIMQKKLNAKFRPEWSFFPGCNTHKWFGKKKIINVTTCMVSTQTHVHNSNDVALISVRYPFCKLMYVLLVHLTGCVLCSISRGCSVSNWLSTYTHVQGWQEVIMYGSQYTSKFIVFFHAWMYRPVCWYWNGFLFPVDGP